MESGIGGWDQWNTIESGMIDLTAGHGQSASLKVVDFPSEGVINFISNICVHLRESAVSISNPP